MESAITTFLSLAGCAISLLLLAGFICLICMLPEAASQINREDEHET
jgi:hypothetical protein